MAHHQQLLDWIENQLINQNLHLGDELPPDRVLAREVGISQNLMRESLKHCEEIGVLRLYEGRKKSIIGVLLREPASAAGPAIGLYLASSQAPRHDLLNTCLLLESYALAGPSFDESAYPELDRIVGAMQDVGMSLSDFHDLEADFHIQLGRLSGNALISALLATLRDAMIEARFELVNKVPLWSATSARLRMEYRAIVDAARSGDPALAQTLLRANLHERFAEAGHQIDMPEELGYDHENPQFTLEPVDIDATGLVPEPWSGAIEPDLFHALATIQPIKSPAACSEAVTPHKNSESQSEQVPALLTKEDSQGIEPHGPEKEAEATAEAQQEVKAEKGGPVESFGSQEQAALKLKKSAGSEQLELVQERAVPTGSATRKRRGTVSPVVRATGLPPRQLAPSAVAPEQVENPASSVESKDAYLQHDYALQEQTQQEISPVEDLEEKILREEARLAVAHPAHHEASSLPSLRTVPAPDPEPASTEDYADEPDEQEQVSIRQPTVSLSQRPTRVVSKKLFDIVNYFGFHQMKPPAPRAQGAEHGAQDLSEGSDAENQRSGDYLEGELTGLDVPEGYEYVDPLAEEDEIFFSDEQELNQDKAWHGPLGDLPVSEAPQEDEQGGERQQDQGPSSRLLGQKKGKKKSKKNRR